MGTTERRLELVLRLRRWAEDRARLELAAAMTEARRARAARSVAWEGLLEARRAFVGLAARSVTGEVTATELQLASLLIDEGRIHLRDAEERASRAEGRLNEARGRLATATRRREAVERLVARLAARRRRAEERRAERELGEVATVAFVRRLREEGGGDLAHG